MSRISPFHFNVNEYNDEELENICPRYLKWLKKVKAFDFSKRKRGKIDRTVLPFELKYKLGESSKTPKRSKNFFSKIRKGGQNLRVRVRTSADLWRRWIRGGIMYNTELNEKDEIEQEEQERATSVVIKAESQSIHVPKHPEVKVSEESDDKNKNAEVVNKTDENEKSLENKIQKDVSDLENNQNSAQNSEQNSEQNSAQNSEQNQSQKTETEESEIKDIQSSAELEINSETIPESKSKEVLKSNTNSKISITNSSTGMPEVVADND